MSHSNSSTHLVAHARTVRFGGDDGDPAAWSTGESIAGYAFETALCLVESQSPLLRPAERSEAAGDIAQRHTQALSSRIWQLARLLDHVDGTFDADETRVLLQAAARVTSELITMFGPAAERRAIDATVSHAERGSAADCLARARQLAQRISTAAAGLAPIRFAA
ncbi:MULTISPECIES: hypothetical protein [Rhodopseudomonas]|nr:MULTISPECIES: hypothetical protein [Rhodopseudomonas]MDF3810902.1 hypothetical protein [Rhodopseudomonas sp. BAL398]WOK19331.1 hypothetical protein RBJ75_07395 [Rhodopseudomonas sp. BAL398]